MSRIPTVLWILVIVVASFMLYQLKYHVQALERQVAQTSHQLEAEKEALHVSAAEWAYLNRPERLERLAQQYLGEDALTVSQIASTQDIPFPVSMQASLSGEEVTPASFHMDK